MSKEISVASAIHAFFDKLGSPGGPPTIAATIAGAYGVKEDSVEFYSIVTAQTENFARLLRQIKLSKIGDTAQTTYRRRKQPKP
jgi:hypothetical protein